MSKNKKENQNQLDDKSNNIIIVPSLKDKINPQSFKFNINPGNSSEKQKIDDLIDPLLLYFPSYLNISRYN